MTLVLLLALAPVPSVAAQAGTAPPATAEEAIANYRQTFKSTDELDCPRSADPNDIVVCARPADAPDPDRLPLPVVPEPGARIVGGLPSGIESMGADRCISRCPQPLRIDLLKAATFAKNLAERLIEGE